MFFSADADWTNATVARGIAEASTRIDLAVPAGIRGFDIDRAVVLQKHEALADRQPDRLAGNRHTFVHTHSASYGGWGGPWLFGLK
jgi:hypothetical protein